MYSPKNKNKTLQINRRIDITDYFQDALSEIEGKGYRFDFRHPLDVKRLRELMNDKRNTTFKSTRDIQSGFYYWDEQRVDFIPSNLGRERGFIFYFICNGCCRRVKYLYEYSSCESPLCRICCGLKYEAPTRKARTISRLIRKPYLSSEGRYTLIKKAGLTMQDFLDSEK
jgi:hypothetical protein